MEPTTKQQILEDLKRQRDSITNHERIGQELGLELTDKQLGHISGALWMCTIIIEQIEEMKE